VDVEPVLTSITNYGKPIRPQKNRHSNWWEWATNLPPRAVHCSMDKRFCGSCPETPPCLFAPEEELSLLVASEGLTSTWPCKLCTKEMRIRWSKTDKKAGRDYCPCWRKASGERRKQYKQWQAKHHKDNILTAERRKVYGKKRQKKNGRAREKQVLTRYSEGRVCAEAECNSKITNKNTTGYCRKHAWIAKEKGE